MSGYRMAVVFFAVGALLALIPALTVSFRRRDPALAFMSAVFPIAVIVDHRALTFRMLAVSGTRPRLGSRSAAGPPRFEHRSMCPTRTGVLKSGTLSDVFSFDQSGKKPLAIPAGVGP
jgi:hypothetical protein